MKGKSAGIIQGVVLCRIFGFMLAMLINLTGADVLFAEKGVVDFRATAGSPNQTYPDTQLTDTILSGKWETARIVNEKNVGGKTETSRYNSMADVKELIRFPYRIAVIDSQTMALSYLGLEEKITAAYTVDGDRLTITEGLVIHSYLLEMSKDSIVLTMVYTYATRRDDQAAGQAESLTEKWIFFLRHEKE